MPHIGSNTPTVASNRCERPRSRAMWLPDVAPAVIMRNHVRRACPFAGIGVTLLAPPLGLNVPGLGAQACTTPYQVPREEILQAMSGHGAYSLTTTTTST